MHIMQKMLNYFVIYLFIFSKTFIRHDHFYCTWILAKENSFYIASNSQVMVHAFHMYMNKVVNVNCIFQPICTFVKMCVDSGSLISCTSHCKVVNNI